MNTTITTCCSAVSVAIRVWRQRVHTTLRLTHWQSSHQHVPGAVLSRQFYLPSQACADINLQCLRRRTACMVQQWRTELLPQCMQQVIWKVHSQMHPVALVVHCHKLLVLATMQQPARPASSLLSASRLNSLIHRLLYIPARISWCSAHDPSFCQRA